MTETKSPVHASFRAHRNWQNDCFSPGKHPPEWWEVTPRSPSRIGATPGPPSRDSVSANTRLGVAIQCVEPYP